MKALRSHCVLFLPPLAGLLALCVGSIVLIGWSINSTALKSLVPGVVSLMPNAALAAFIRPQRGVVRPAAAKYAVLVSKFSIVDDEGSRRGQR